MVSVISKKNGTSTKLRVRSIKKNWWPRGSLCADCAAKLWSDVGRELQTVGHYFYDLHFLRNPVSD